MRQIRHRGPNLAVVASVYVILKIASVFPVASLSPDRPYFPELNAPLNTVVSYFSTHTHAVLLCAFLQVGTAIPFAIIAATLISQLQFLGVRAAGAYIALAGGLMAAMSEFFCGAMIAVLGQQPVVQDPVLLHAIHYLVVSFGGPGFTMPFGLLMAGVSVTAAFLKLLPKWIVVFGLVLAGIGELSWLSLLFRQADVLIPLARWPGFVWLIATGFALPRTIYRHSASSSPMEKAAAA